MDYLSGTNIYLNQRKDMFRCNTDTALLGLFMKINNGETVLDIGCNNGALMLYASLQSPNHIYGIDLFKEALELAKENLEYNKVLNFTLIHGDVTNTELPKVDVVVCNPPYFDTKIDGHINENEFLRFARHENTLTLETLFSAVLSSLNENGRFYLVHRASRITDIFEIASKSKLRPKEMQIIYDENKDEATAVLIEFVKSYQGNLRVLQPKIMKRAQKESM